MATNPVTPNKQGATAADAEGSEANVIRSDEDAAKEAHKTAPTNLDTGALTNLDSVGSGQAIPSGVDLAFIGLDGKSFTIKTTQRVASGSEATLFEAISNEEDGSGFNRYVARLSYRPEDPRRRAQRQAITKRIYDLNSSIGKDHYKSTHIVPIITYGEVTDVANGESIHFDVVIMPHCNELGDVDYVTLRNQITPALFTSVFVLHAMHIIHRDIKPGHLLNLNGSICLIDFGISRELGADQDIASTQHDDHTPGYSSPRDIYLLRPESDYYSIGWTLAYFYLGKHPLQEHIDAGTLNVELAKNTPERVVCVNPSHEPLVALMNNLMQEDADKRLGAEEIKKWLVDPKGYIFPKPAVPQETIFTRPFKTRDASINTLEELVRYCANPKNWNTAKKHLYKRDIEEWCRQNCRFDLALALNEITEENPETVHNQDLGLSLALFRLSDEDPGKRLFFWYGLDVGIKHLGELLAIDVKEVKTALCHLFASGFMAWAIEEISGPNDPQVVFFRQLQRIGGSYPVMAYYLARNQFATSLTGRKGWKSADEAFAALTHAPSEFYVVVGKQESAEALLGYLAVDNLERTLAARRELSFDEGCVLKNAEVFLRLFESLSTNKSAVRIFYLNYGPKGDIAWIRNHIDLYQPLNDTASRISGNISGNRIAGNSIDEIAQNQVVLDQEVSNLRAEFFNEPLSRQQGSSPGTKGFIADELDCYFLHTFYGRVVPHGYACAMLKNKEPDSTSPKSMPVRIDIPGAAKQRQSTSEDISGKTRGVPISPAKTKEKKDSVGSGGKRRR